MVKAEANEPEAILAAMKAGAFFSSQGPAIHEIGIGGDTVEIACSPVSTIALVGRGTRAETAYGRQLTRARLPLTKFAGDWFRIVVIDAAGRRAWSNPIWPG